MANVSATIISHEGTGMEPTGLALLYAAPLGHQTAGEKDIPQNMKPLQVVVECTLVDQVSFCVAVLGLHTRIGINLTRGMQLHY